VFNRINTAILPSPMLAGAMCLPIAAAGVLITTLQLDVGLMALMIAALVLAAVGMVRQALLLNADAIVSLSVQGQILNLTTRSGHRIETQPASESIVLPGLLILVCHSLSTNRFISHAFWPDCIRYRSRVMILHRGNIEQTEAFRRLRVLLRNRYFVAT